MYKSDDEVIKKETYTHYGYFGEGGIIGDNAENFSSYGDAMMII